MLGNGPTAGHCGGGPLRRRAARIAATWKGRFDGGVGQDHGLRRASRRLLSAVWPYAAAAGILLLAGAIALGGILLSWRSAYRHNERWGLGAVSLEVAAAHFAAHQADCEAIASIAARAADVGPVTEAVASAADWRRCEAALASLSAYGVHRGDGRAYPYVCCIQLGAEGSFESRTIVELWWAPGGRPPGPGDGEALALLPGWFAVRREL